MFSICYVVRLVFSRNDADVFAIVTFSPAPIESAPRTNEMKKT